jgi:hypothetical protein
MFICCQKKKSKPIHNAAAAQLEYVLVAARKKSNKINEFRLNMIPTLGTITKSTILQRREAHKPKLL